MASRPRSGAIPQHTPRGNGPVTVLNWLLYKDFELDTHTHYRYTVQQICDQHELMNFVLDLPLHLLNPQGL